MTFDNDADFGWGTHWVYVLAPRERLAPGDLGQLFVASANV